MGNNQEQINQKQADILTAKAYLYETHNEIEIYKNFDVNMSAFDNAVEITKEQAQEVLSKLAKSLI